MKKITLDWSGYADTEEVAAYCENLNDNLDEERTTLEEAERLISEDQDYWDMQWDCFTEDLSELMGACSYWRDDASRMGWLNRTGYKVFKAENGLDFIRAISPDTDCHYTITPHYKGFKVRIAHHDAPMGEYHVIRPITSNEYEKENND